MTPEASATTMALQHIGRVLERTDNSRRPKMRFVKDRSRASTGQKRVSTGSPCGSGNANGRRLLHPSTHRPNSARGDFADSLAAHADDPMFQLAKASRSTRASSAARNRTAAARATEEDEPASGCASAMSRRTYATTRSASRFEEVFELHDKASVEVFAYSFGDPAARTRRTNGMRAAVDHWRDIGALSDRQAAQKIADDAIDVLVDVNGYTKHARTKIFAYRPAPIIVNWCGYPGTMGSPHHHYLIADGSSSRRKARFSTPKRLCGSLATSRSTASVLIAPSSPTRAEVGLPDNAFVFASFNGMQS